MAFSLRTLFRKEQSDPSHTEPTGSSPPQGEGARAPHETNASRSAIFAEAQTGAPVRQPASPFQIAASSPPAIHSSLPPSQPMNIASPFQAASEEGFTIRELSILLPPQLLKSEGLPPDYLIPLPLESLRATFLQGRPCLRLSQIFQSCPYLFNRQLMAGEDQEVALPYQKVRRILESAGMPQAAPRATQPVPNSPPVQANSPFQVRESAAERGQGSPFSLAPQSEQVVLKPQDNPFQMAPQHQQHPAAQQAAQHQPPAPAQMASPFQVASSLPTHPQGPVQPSHPFPPAQQNGPASSPFQIANPSQSPFGLPPAPPEQQQPTAPPQQQTPFKPQSNFAESSPFQVAAPSPGFPPAQAPAPAPPQASFPKAPAPLPQQNPSPFTVAEPAPAPSNERPPAFPAPHSSSPFQISQQPPAMKASPFSPAEHLPPPPAQAQAPTLPPFAKPQQHATPQGHAPLPAMAPIQQFPVPQQEAPRERQPNERPSSPPILKRSEPPVSGSPLPPLQPVEPVAKPQLPPFTPPAAAPAAPMPVPEPAAREETRTVSLRLRSVLQNASVEELGFDPANVPDAVMVKFPLPLIMSQLPSGKVIVQISHVTEGVADKFRPAFSRSRADSQLSLPLSELFHAMPPDSIPSAPQPKPVEQPKQNPIFTTPFQNVAAEDATRVAKPAPILPPLPVPSREAQEQAEASMSSFLASHEDLGRPRSAETLTEAPPANMPLRGAAPAPANEPIMQDKISLPEITPPVGGLPPLLPSQLPKRALQPPAQAQPQHYPPQQQQAPNAAPIQLPPLQPAAPVAQAQPQAASPVHQSPVAQAKPATPAAADAQDLQFGYQERPEMMAVRYLLESPTDLNLGQIAERLAQLNSLCAAVIISPAGQENGGSNAGNSEVFFSKAAKSHQSLIALAESIGMPPHGAFTLRADQMVRTFFIEGDICIAVLHSESIFAPGVRDKLILLTRELAKLHA